MSNVILVPVVVVLYSVHLHPSSGLLATGIIFHWTYPRLYCEFVLAKEEANAMLHIQQCVTISCMFCIAVCIISRVHNIYTKESILLSYTPVEGHIVKF